jgi:hypothetical protein
MVLISGFITGDGDNDGVAEAKGVGAFGPVAAEEKEEGRFVGRMMMGMGIVAAVAWGKAAVERRRLWSSWLWSAAAAALQGM